MAKIKGTKIAKHVSITGNLGLRGIKSAEASASSDNDSQIVKYYIAGRRHIMEELNSNKKSSDILERLIKISSITNKVLAEKVFEISPKTLHTYKNSDKVLPVRINEQVIKLEELYKKGIELFESIQQFNKWLKIESYGLGNIKPIDMFNSITGIDLVYEELIRIEFGATA